MGCTLQCILEKGENSFSRYLETQKPGKRKVFEALAFGELLDGCWNPHLVKSLRRFSIEEAFSSPTAGSYAEVSPSTVSNPIAQKPVEWAGFELLGYPLVLPITILLTCSTLSTRITVTF